MIAALYIDPRGPYPKMPGVECWGLPDRDARCYMGPHPIVAHPPCAPWSKMKHLHKPSDLEDCALRAVEQVRAYGGVLEHPAHSKLWRVEHRMGKLPMPGESDSFGFTVALTQVEWGHCCRKPTWIYCARVPRTAIEAPPFPGREPTHWASGGRHPSSRKGAPVPPDKKVASAEQRRRTPQPFADYLVRLAASVQP